MIVRERIDTFYPLF